MTHKLGINFEIDATTIETNEAMARLADADWGEILTRESGVRCEVESVGTYFDNEEFP